jgi:hypothetical protein
VECRARVIWRGVLGHPHDRVYPCYEPVRADPRRIRIYICLRLLRRDLPRGVGRGRDPPVRQEQYVFHAALSRPAADPSALALAMARDGSSGGCIRMCVITEDKVERHFVPGNELPRFWEGKEVIGGLAQTTKPVAAA